MKNIKLNIKEEVITRMRLNIEDLRDTKRKYNKEYLFEIVNDYIDTEIRNYESQNNCIISSNSKIFYGYEGNYFLLNDYYEFREAVLNKLFQYKD